MHGPLHRAPDPRGPSWLKSPPLQPGGTGEKFTIAAAKFFFTRSFSVSVFKPPTPIQDEVLYVLWIPLMWLSGIVMNVLTGNKLLRAFWNRGRYWWLGDEIEINVKRGNSYLYVMTVTKKIKHLSQGKFQPVYGEWHKIFLRALLYLLVLNSITDKQTLEDLYLITFFKEQFVPACLSCAHGAISCAWFNWERTVSPHTGRNLKPHMCNMNQHTCRLIVKMHRYWKRGGKR